MSAGLATSDEPAEYAAVEVVGFYRDDPSSANGLCATAHTTTPYVLRLNFGPLTLKIRNWDSDDHSEPPGIHAVFACHGAIHL